MGQPWRLVPARNRHSGEKSPLDLDQLDGLAGNGHVDFRQPSRMTVWLDLKPLCFQRLANVSKAGGKRLSIPGFRQPSKHSQER
jgi:hypothetical protein